jgi:hypothetical protein
MELAALLKDLRTASKSVEFQSRKKRSEKPKVYTLEGKIVVRYAYALETVDNLSADKIEAIAAPDVAPTHDEEEAAAADASSVSSASAENHPPTKEALESSSSILTLFKRPSAPPGLFSFIFTLLIYSCRRMSSTSVLLVDAEDTATSVKDAEDTGASDKDSVSVLGLFRRPSSKPITSVPQGDRHAPASSGTTTSFTSMFRRRPSKVAEYSSAGKSYQVT